jgi:predicted nucleic acid-binding protein
LATEVDDGEAQVLAVGMHRGLVVATDDRRARSVVTHLGVGLLSTPELVVTWAAADETQAVNVTRAILDIEVRARYRPRAADPHRATWDGLKDS